MHVVLPAPLGPSSPITSPRPTDTDTSDSTTRLSYDLAIDTTDRPCITGASAIGSIVSRRVITSIPAPSVPAEWLPATQLASFVHAARLIHASPARSREARRGNFIQKSAVLFDALTRVARHQPAPPPDRPIRISYGRTGGGAGRHRAGTAKEGRKS